MQLVSSFIGSTTSPNNMSFSDLLGCYTLLTTNRPVQVKDEKKLHDKHAKLRHLMHTVTIVE